MLSRAERVRCSEETSVIEGLCGRLFVRKQASLRAERALVQRKQASSREASGQEGGSPVEGAPGQERPHQVNITALYFTQIKSEQN